MTVPGSDPHVRVWTAALVGLVAIRLAIPLAALAGSGRDLPGIPPYTYTPLNGDSYGFYAAAREFLASLGQVGASVLALHVLLVTAGIALGVRLWRRGPRWAAPVVVAGAVSIAVAAVIAEMEPSGAAVIGWPLLWSLPMLPFRALGLPLDPNVAFVLGFVLTLGALAAGVVATAYAGFHATGRRAVGIGAAALYALWPLLARLLAGPSAWENGQWNADVGLHLYTEPFSTAFVAGALALLFSPRLDELRLALAGLALGFATTVKLTNGLLAALAVLLVALILGRRRAVPLAAGCLALAPIVVVYYPLGYPEIPNVPGWSYAHPFRNWADSLIFEPRVLIVLAPLALVGLYALRRQSLVLGLLVAAILSNALVYSFYEAAYLHPRFLYAALPALLVLEAAGALNLGGRLGGRGTRPAVKLRGPPAGARG